jgi:hypothetical protein
MTASSAVTPRRVRSSLGERGTDRVHDRGRLKGFVQRVQRELASRSASELGKRPLPRSPRSDNRQTQGTD